jgi:hypothetical protein
MTAACARSHWPQRGTTTLIPLITGILGLTTAAIILLLVRRDQLHARYGLWWMGAAIAFALLGIFPWVFDELANYLGVSYAPVLALMLAIILLVLKILVMDLERSRNQVKMNRLVQRIGLLEGDIRELQKKQGVETDQYGKDELED